ncbi:hypothetical protein RyT2_06980 [Pseudolactococcus yaeyamensis]
MKVKQGFKIIGVITCLYLFSSVYRNLKVPVVTTLSVEPYTIIDKVEGEAKIDYQGGFNTYGLEDLVVEKIFIKKEQEVAKDMPLFQVNLSFLNEKINLIEQEIKKLTLQKQNLVSQQEQKETDYHNQIKMLNLEYQQSLQMLQQEQKDIKEESQKKENALKIEQTTQTYQQKLAQLQLSAPIVDSTIETTELEIQQLQQKLLKYQEVQNRQGNFLAQEAGSIQDVKISVGDKMTEQLAVMIRDTQSLKELHIVLSDDENKIKIGQKVNLIVQGRNGKRTFQGFKVQDIMTEQNGGKKITVLDSENKLGVAESIRAEVIIYEKNVQRSLPISTVYEDNQGKYVLVSERKKTILGEQIFAKRQNIEISEVFQNTVVLENENVDNEKIIDSTEKQINIGDIIRVAEK